MQANDYINFLGSMPIKYFSLSIFLFTIGLISLILNKDNLIKILISFEVIVLSTILNFTLFYSINDNDNRKIGAIFVFVILSVAASEAAIGLAIFFSYFKKAKSILVKNANSLNG